MSWKTWVPLSLAIVLGVFAMKIAHDVMAKKNNESETHETKIVTLTKDLPAGAQIAVADLASKKVADDALMPGAITNPTEAEGRVLITAGTKDGAILQTMLAPRGVVGGLQAVIPEGMRAITIEINEFSGVAGNLVPGCRVDVISTLAGEVGGDMITRTVVQNIKVQALGMRRIVEGDQQAAPMRSVTLVATPPEAEAIELAAVAGRAHLLLRSSNDLSKPLSEGVSLSDLRGKGGQLLKLDPFASIQNAGLSRLKNPANGSTTQPGENGGQSIPFNMAGHRQIHIIRGSTESQVIVDDPPPVEAPAAAPVENRLMTDTGATEPPVTAAPKEDHLTTGTGATESPLTAAPNEDHLTTDTDADEAPITAAPTDNHQLTNANDESAE